MSEGKIAFVLIVLFCIIAISWYVRIVSCVLRIEDNRSRIEIQIVFCWLKKGFVDIGNAAGKTIFTGVSRRYIQCSERAGQPGL